MPPTTLLGLLLFLWLVTPGFLFTLLAGRRRAAAKESVFQETAGVVVTSVLFSSLGTAVAALVLHAIGVNVDLGRVIGDSRAYLAQHYRAVGLFLGLQILASCVAAVLANVAMALLTRVRTGQASPRLAQESAWDRPLGRVPRGSRPRVWVRLSSGIELLGFVAAVGHEIDVGERELVLRDPIEMRYPGQDATHPLVEKRLIVQGADIEFLAVKYVLKEPPIKRSWRQRRQHRLKVPEPAGATTDTTALPTPTPQSQRS